MSEASSDDANKPMEQPKGNLPATTDDYDETSTPSKNLSDMPIHVVGLIIERSDYKQQLKLRKVSKSLRALVDNQKPACKSIEVEFEEDYVNIVFNNYYVTYTDNIDVDDESETSINVVRDDFKKAAFDDLASTLKNPKLQLEKFNTFGDLEVEEKDLKKYYNEIQRVLKPLNHQLFVKEIDLIVRNSSWLLSILPYLKPGVLEKISLNFESRGFRRNYPTGMEQIASLDQWKQAETLEFPDFFDLFPMEYATHFKRFKFREHRLDRNKFTRIRDFLSKLDNFEHCTMSCFEFLYVPGLVHQVLGEPVSSNAAEEIFHQPITDSDFYLEFTWPKRTDVKVEKKKRESNR